MIKWLILFLPVLALASGDDESVTVEQEVNVDTVLNANPTMNANPIMNAEGSTLTNSTSSRAYGFGLGDVDIAQCYRSYQLLVWQGSQINPFCVADSYDQKGLHIMAAVVRCDIGFIRQHFDTDAACIEANTMVVQAPEPPPPPAPTPTLSIPDTHIQQEVEIHTEQREAFETLEQRLARIEAGQRDAARKAAVKRAYVQQTIEELQNDNDPEE
jgi:hypothetical protein